MIPNPASGHSQISTATSKSHTQHSINLKLWRKKTKAPPSVSLMNKCQSVRGWCHSDVLFAVRLELAMASLRGLVNQLHHRTGAVISLSLFQMADPSCEAWWSIYWKENPGRQAPYENDKRGRLGHGQGRTICMKPSTVVATPMNSPRGYWIRLSWIHNLQSPWHS